ncbi:unnamed protein product, partial [Rotaria sp. Silwood1]
MLIDPTVVTEEMSLMPGTRCPVFESFFIADNEMVLNIIDSPGLFERGSKVKDIRDNMAIMATIEECINREITKLHIICFCMSFGDGIQQEDVESVKILVKYLGEGKQHRQSKSIHQPIEQNILLLGPSNSGKRTLMKVLEDPCYIPPYETGDEEVILDQFKTIYNNREQFIQFIEHNCNIQPFNIQLQINPSPISIFEKNRR